MQDLIQKYSSFTPHDSMDKATISTKTVLLTGVTGGLASILLSNLLKRTDISRIYCLVRASSSSAAHDRVMLALQSRELLEDLPENAIEKIVALPADLSLPTLGLEAGILEEMLSGLTHIIHSAWAVNFNLPLLSFEPQHIRGVYNLLEHVALRTTHSRPAKFYFCSSVSAASGTPKPATIAETQIKDPSHAQKMGYGRSKFRGRTYYTCCHAKHRDAYRLCFVLGSWLGDTRRAVWNDTEAIALMVRSALPESAGCLPSLDESPSWLPVDRAAEVIEQLAISQEDAGMSEQGCPWTQTWSIMCSIPRRSTLART